MSTFGARALVGASGMNTVSAGNIVGAGGFQTVSGGNIVGATTRAAPAMQTYGAAQTVAAAPMVSTMAYGASTMQTMAYGASTMQTMAAPAMQMQTIAPAMQMQTSGFQVGQSIKYQSRSNGEWYPGKINGRSGNGWQVVLNDGMAKEVDDREIWRLQQVAPAVQYATAAHPMTTMSAPIQSFAAPAVEYIQQAQAVEYIQAAPIQSFAAPAVEYTQAAQQVEYIKQAPRAPVAPRDLRAMGNVVSEREITVEELAANDRYAAVEAVAVQAPRQIEVQQTQVVQAIQQAPMVEYIQGAPMTTMAPRTIY